MDFIPSSKSEVFNVLISHACINVIPELIFLIFVFFSSATLLASQKKTATPSIPSTFLLRPVFLNLQRGGNAEIIVEVVAPFGGESKFEISRAPKYGTLDSGQRVDSNIRRFHYQSSSDNYSEQDSFEFRVKAPNHAWSTYTAKIIIRNSDPKITLIPDVMNFGKVPIGVTNKKTLLISNSYGATISGRLQVRAPWSIEGEDIISLGQGETSSIKILFSPSASQKYVGVCKIAPDNACFPFASLSGDGVAPFFLSSTSVIVSPEHPEAVFQVANNIEKPITVSCSGDGELNYPRPLMIQPASVETMKVSSARIKLLEDDCRIFHAHIDADHYSQKIDISVLGPKGKLVIEAPPEDKPLHSRVGEPLIIGGTIRNQSRVVRFIQLGLQNPQDPQKPALVESFELMGGKETPFSLVWKTTDYLPKVLLMRVLENEKQIASFSWNVVKNDTSNQNISVSAIPSQKIAETITDNVGVRLATGSEREKLVVYERPYFRNSLLRRRLVLRWLYYGSENPDFQIRKRLKNNALSNRTEVEQTEWSKLGLFSGVIKKGPDGIWEADLPMPLPGFHDYMVTTDSPGEKLAAIQSVHISWGVFLWPYMRVFLLISIIALVFKVIRARM